MENPGTIEIDSHSYPKDVEQWWAWLEHDWVNILKIIKTFTKNKKTIKEIQTYKETKDIKIASLLDTCWNCIPETSHLKDIPGWFIFSELISELDLLERDQSNMELFKERHYHYLNTIADM